MQVRRRHAVAVSIVLSSLLMVRCSGDLPFDPAVGFSTTLETTEWPDTIRVGESAVLRTTVMDDVGQRVLNTELDFSTSASDILAVVPTPGADSTVAEALWPGEATVTARLSMEPFQEREVSRSVVAVLAGVQRDAGIPDSLRFNAIGDTVVVRAHGRAADGSLLAGTGLVWSGGGTGAVGIAPFPGGDSARVFSAANGVDALTVTHALCAGACAASFPYRVRQVVATLGVESPPDTLIAGQTVVLDPVARDSNGVRIDGADVAWTSADPSIASVDADGRVQATTAGSVVLAASSGEAAASMEVVVVPGQPTTLAIVAGEGQEGTAGELLADSLAVRVTDDFGNGVAGVAVSWGTAGEGGLTPASTVTGDDGSARSAWLLGTTAGESRATATATGLTGSPATFTAAVAAAEPAELAFTVEPSNTRAGAPVSPGVRVEVRDAFGNTVTTATDGVTLAIDSNPGDGTLSGTTTVAAVDGIATFGDLSVDAAGTGYTLAAASGSLTGATSGAFDVTPASAAQLAFVAEPSNTTAGAAMAPAVRVELRDAFGNTVTTATDDVTLAIGTNPGGGTLSGTTTVAAVDGIATFSDLSVDAAGTGYTLAATSGSFTGATSGAFDVTPAAAAALAFATEPSSTTAGAAIGPAVRVEVRDAFGNAVTSSTDNVTVALDANPSGGTLSGTTTVAAVSGVATFGDLSIDRAGTGYTLAAASGSLAGATSGGFDIGAGAASTATSTVTASPATITADGTSSSAVTVRLRDAHDNALATGGGHAVALATSAGTLSGVTDAGDGSFTATLTSATSPGVATVTATVDGSAIDDTADVAFEAVWYRDADADGYGDPDVTQSAPTQPVSYVDNAADCDDTDQAIRPGAAETDNGVDDDCDGLADEGIPSQLAIVAAPSSATAGEPMTLRVEVRDDHDATVTDATNSVTVAIGTNPAGGTLSGTTTLAAVAGVATFSDLSLDRAGSGYTLVVSSGTLAGAATAAFDVSPGDVAAVVFTAQPSTTTAGEIMAPVEVTIRDGSGNTVTSATDDISLVLDAHAGMDALAGTTTVAAVDGVATFDDLSLVKAITGHTLRATVAGSYSVVSQTFDITAAAPDELLKAGGDGQTVVGGLPAYDSLAVRVRDAYGNAVPGVSVAWAVTSGGGSVSPATSVTSAAGVARTQWTVGSTAGTHTATATVAGLGSVTFTANVTQYEDLSTNGGTLISGVQNCDDCGAAVTLPFAFQYWGTTYTTVDVSTNGFIAFGGSGGASAYSNMAIPNGQAPNGVVAPFWDDLTTLNGGQLYSKVDGSPGSRRFIIHWKDAQFYNMPGTYMNVQVILYEGSNRIEFLYGPGQSGGSGREFGSSATIGLEHPNGAEGVQASYNQADAVFPGRVIGWVWTGATYSWQ